MVVVAAVLQVPQEPLIVSVAIIITMKIVIRIVVEASVLEVQEMLLVVIISNLFLSLKNKKDFLARSGFTGGGSGAFRTGNDGNSRGNFF